MKTNPFGFSGQGHRDCSFLHAAAGHPAAALKRQCGRSRRNSSKDRIHLLPRRRAPLGMLFVIAATLTGCISARRTPPTAPPLQFSDAKLTHGQQVFYQHCHHCHPQGGTGLGPAIVNKPLPAFLMKFQVRHGLGTMPSFKEDVLPPQDLDALVAYLKAVHANKPSPENVRNKRN